jgi:16S rRNA (adenine1518-N6/adenine1519-N6)-dimethyltransferase
VTVDSPETFEQVVRSTFTNRRKKLSNAARAVAESRGRSAPEALLAAGIDPGRRPETLTVDEFGRLANVLNGSR